MQNTRPPAANLRIYSFSCQHVDDIAKALSSGCDYLFESGDKGIDTQHLCDVGPDVFLTLSISSHSAYYYPVAQTISQHLKQLLILDDETFYNIQTGLHEAIVNGVVHGNCGISQNITTADEMQRFYELISERLNTPSCADKRITITISSREENVLNIQVTDEGNGFDYNKHRTRSHDGTEAAHGRGMQLLEEVAAAIDYSNGGKTIDMQFDLSPKENESTICKPATIQSTALILIVGNMEYEWQMLTDMLRREGFANFARARSGMQALNFMQSAHPDLIITDIDMPVMNGLTFVNTLKKHADHAQTPVLMQMPAIDVQSRLKAFEGGVDDVLLQPINERELLLRVNALLARAQSHKDLSAYRSRIEEEILAARDMHQSLMPKPLELQQIEADYNLRISSYFEPSSELGGDLWSIFPITETQIGVCICDFTGHGVGASINTFRLYTMMENQKDLASMPGEFLGTLNNRLRTILPSFQFATFLYGLIDTQRNQFLYASAGACPPIILRADTKKCEIIDSSGVPLGIVKNNIYQTHMVDFNPKDSLFIYSDALIETAVDDTKNFLQEASIAQLLLEHYHDDAGVMQQKTLRSLLQKLRLFEGNPLKDDLTISYITRLE